MDIYILLNVQTALLGLLASSLNSLTPEKKKNIRVLAKLDEIDAVPLLSDC